MKIEHLAAAGLLALIAYKFGKAQGSTIAASATASVQANDVQKRADWWTYAGSWV